MTKRDFFRIIIKLFGLYSLVITVFNVIPSSMSYYYSDFGWYAVLFVLAALLISVGLFIVLLFKANWIIGALKLDAGFDDDRIDFGNINQVTILNFAVVIVGGLLLIDNISPFIRNSYEAFRSVIAEKQSHAFDSYFYQPVDYFSLTVSGISILIGYLMLTNYSAIGSWILKKDKKNNLSDTENPA